MLAATKPQHYMLPFCLHPLTSTSRPSGALTPRLPLLVIHLYLTVFNNPQQEQELNSIS